MKLSINLLAFYILFWSSANAQIAFEQFPKLEQVYAYLDKQIDAPCKDCEFELAKKMDGYYLAIVPNNDFTPKTTYLKCWDAATKKYVAPAVKEYIEFPEEGIDNGLASLQWKKKESDFNYLYGYENSAVDLIAYLEKKKTLTNPELEMLARAYSSQATDYIHPSISGLIFTATKDLTTPNYEKVAADRVASFMETAEKSIAAYEKIRANDPGYEPLYITDLAVKINEDLMHYYLTLKFVKEGEKGKTFLNRIHFTDSELAAATTILNGCAKNSVLLTTGDNDSYPFWYIQDKLDLHKDITVINTSLMEVPFYFDFIKQTSPVKFALTLEEYDKLLHYWSVLSKESVETKNFKEWLSELTSSIRSIESSINNGTTPEKEYPETFSTLMIARSKMQVSISSTEGYFGGVDIALLDILATNPNTALYVTYPPAFERIETQGAFVLRGTVYEYTGNSESNYWDTESAKYLETSITSTKAHFSKQSSLIDEMLYMGWCTGVQTAYYAEDPNGPELYKQVRDKINENELIAYGNDQLVDCYTGALRYVNADDFTDFLNLYSPKANSRLEAISTTKTTNEKDIETLVFIFELYSRTLAGETIRNSELDPIQKETLRILKEKVNKLLLLKSNKEELVWSKEKLMQLKTSLESAHL